MERSYSTKTAEFGKITFTAPASNEGYAGYVYIDGEAFKDRKQICHGGDFMGSTVQATTKGLKKAAQAWMRQRREWLRKDGI